MGCRDSLDKSSFDRVKKNEFFVKIRQKSQKIIKTCKFGVSDLNCGQKFKFKKQEFSLKIEILVKN